MKNNKGFTLIELLAVITILAILMMISVPNVISVIDKQKKNTYVNDAIKMISRAKYTMNSNTDIPNPDDTPSKKAVILYLNYINNGDIENDPNGNEYDEQKSFVIIKLNSGYIEYWVQLVSFDNKGVANGIALTNEQMLLSDTAILSVKSGFTVYNSTNDTEKKNLCNYLYNSTSVGSGCLPNTNIFIKTN